MKRAFFLFVTGAVVCAVSCQKETPDNKMMMISDTELVVYSVKSEYKIRIDSANEWSVSNDAQWLSASPEQGTPDDHVLTVSVEENMTGMDREAVITVTSAERSRTIKVTQQPALTVDAEIIEAGSDGGDYPINIAADFPYEIIIPQDAQSWVGVSTQTRSIDKTATVTIAPNQRYTSRSCTIGVGLVNNHGILKEIKITQREAVSPLLQKWQAMNVGYQFDDRGRMYLLDDGLASCDPGYRPATIEDYKDLMSNYVYKWDDTPIDNLPTKESLGIWFGMTEEDVLKATFWEPNGCIYFPARGRSLDNNGMLSGQNIEGFYYSSTPTEDNGAYLMYISREGPSVITFGEHDAHLTWYCSLRCVKE